jgi:hypothetical protein
VFGEGVAEGSNRLHRASLALLRKAKGFPLPQERQGVMGAFPARLLRGFLTIGSVAGSRQ